MKNFFVLRVLKQFRFLFHHLGVNFEAMQSILRVKLIMDGRRAPNVIGKQAQKKGNNFVKALPIYFLIGLFLLFFILFPTPVYFSMNLVYGMLLFMVISTLITEFSSVLLDVREKEVLLSKPVDKRTMNVAKILHILLYLLALLSVMSVPLLIAGTIKHGIWFLAVFLGQLFFIASFSIFITSILYFFILMFFDSEKLKDIINYFQIAISVFIIIGLQIVGRVFSFVELDLGSIASAWWNYLIPTAWFSAPYALLVDKIYQPQFIWLTALGATLSVLFIIIYVKLVAPYFEQNLSKLSDNSGVKSGKGMLLNKWAKFICTNNTERCFYIFSKRLMASDRSFKLRLYPLLAMAAFFPLIFLLNNIWIEESFLAGFQAMRGGNNFLYLYFSLLIYASSLPLLANSEGYEGAWIYKVLPVGQPASMQSGALKALILHFLLPSYLAAGAVFILIIGVSALPHIAVIFLNLIFLLLVLFNQLNLPLPFSQKFTQVKSDQMMILLVSLVFSILFLVLHFISLRLRFGVFAYIILMGAGIAVYWRKTFSKPPGYIQS